MKTKWIVSAVVAAMSVTAVLGAQSMTAMGKPSQDDMNSTTYTGCVESWNHGAAFLLTKIEHQGAEMTDSKKDTMSKSFALAGMANLDKHVGEKVSVTGSVSKSSTGTMRPDVPTLTLKTLKVIAKSCS